MKDVSLFTALVIIALSAFLGCTPNQPQITYLKATENGDSFRNNDCSVYLGNGGSGATGLQIMSSGQHGNRPDVFSPSITLNIANYTGLGTYIMDSSQGTKGLVSDRTNGYTQHYSANGSITVTASTPYISGTFSFTCQDSGKVTNGAFTGKPY